MSSVIHGADSIRDAVREYFAEAFLDAEQVAAIKNDDDLLLVFDSLQLLRMVMELESRYSLKIENSELTKENLGTIDNIATFVMRKLS
jgi:acyl carrier protein